MLTSILTSPHQLKKVHPFSIIRQYSHAIDSNNRNSRTMASICGKIMVKFKANSKSHLKIDMNTIYIYFILYKAYLIILLMFIHKFIFTYLY